MQEIISEIVESIEQKELVIFCGAGISYNSGLPVVAQFIPYVLMQLNDVSAETINQINEELWRISNYEERQKRLIEKVSEVTEIPEKAITKLFYNFPFEAFIELIQAASNVYPLYDIYDADKPESNSVKPNNNHILLARLLKGGKLKAVVTTNFDQLIEKALALEPQPIREGMDYVPFYQENDFGKINWEDDGILLVKLHGSVHDKKNLSITINI